MVYSNDSLLFYASFVLFCCHLSDKVIALSDEKMEETSLRGIICQLTNLSFPSAENVTSGKEVDLFLLCKNFSNGSPEQVMHNQSEKVLNQWFCHLIILIILLVLIIVIGFQLADLNSTRFWNTARSLNIITSFCKQQGKDNSLQLLSDLENGFLEQSQPRSECLSQDYFASVSNLSDYCREQSTMATKSPKQSPIVILAGDAMIKKAFKSTADEEQTWCPSVDDLLESISIRSEGELVMKEDTFANGGIIGTSTPIKELIPLEECNLGSSLEDSMDELDCEVSEFTSRSEGEVIFY